MDAKMRDVPISLTVLNRHKIPITSSHTPGFLWDTDKSKISISRRCTQSASTGELFRQTSSSHSGPSEADGPIFQKLDVASVICFPNFIVRLILSFGMSATACEVCTGRGKHESSG
jgi:hypothetical protein